MRIPGRRRSTSMLPLLVILVLTCLGIGPTTAYADSSPSQTSPAGTGGISVFQDRDVSVTVSGGVVAAINSCIADASDGVIQNQQDSCQQVASAGNFIDGGSIVIYQSQDVSITVSGGAAAAINECVNDASDGVIQIQQNACDQTASAGNVVTVDSIVVSASRNVSVDINGGIAAAINECVNDASDGVIQIQQNACDQAANAGNVVDVGDITVTASKNVTINITGGTAMALYYCVNDASDGVIQDQQDACTQVADTGNSTSVGSIFVYNSKNVTVKIDGAVAIAVHNCVTEAATHGTVRTHRDSCTKAAAARNKAETLGSGHPRGRNGHPAGQQVASLRLSPPPPRGHRSVS
jgi:hypothetical protein